MNNREIELMRNEIENLQAEMHLLRQELITTKRSFSLRYEELNSKILIPFNSTNMILDAFKDPKVREAVADCNSRIQRPVPPDTESSGEDKQQSPDNSFYLKPDGQPGVSPQDKGRTSREVYESLPWDLK